MLNSTTMRLERNIDKIMNAWRLRTLNEIVASKHQSTLALKDSLPEYLSQLAQALSETSNRSEARKRFDKDESTRVGKKHGKERAKNSSYTISQMIFEYHILRQVLCDVLEEEAPLSTVEREVIVCSIEQAVNDAATQFSESLKEVEIDSAKIIAAEQQKLYTMISESPAANALMRGPEFIFEKINIKWQQLASDRVYLGQNFEAVYPEMNNSPVFQHLSEAFQTGEPRSRYEVKVIMQMAKGLEERYYDYSFIPISDIDGLPYGIFAHFMDVTDQVLAKHALTSLNDQLNEEKNIRDKFVASLSHDLRTPLTSIKMIAQILAKKGHGPDEIKKTSDRIVSGVDRIDTMIQDLLDFTHFHVGEKLPLSFQVCDINSLCSSTVDELNVIYGMRFILRAQEQFDVVCDSGAIKRIIENLATNAVKYGSKNTGITLELKRKNDILEISIHNLGTPINQEEQKTIFEPYKRTESAEKSAQRGWGIGLPLVRGLAEAHGGVARVDSDNTGTAFTVSIPLHNNH
ncbi:MAG TPA: ATP-binding protein [Bacteriovoracaceae bacterium]|nr:ATP-binding protein [Bacteriovoracaceae bacterium]